MAVCLVGRAFAESRSVLITRAAQPLWIGDRLRRLLTRSRKAPAKFGSRLDHFFVSLPEPTLRSGVCVTLTAIAYSNAGHVTHLRRACPFAERV